MNVIKNNKYYYFMIYFLITPILVMIANLFNIYNYIVFYIPNILMIILSIKYLYNNRYKMLDKKEYIILFIFIACSIISCSFSLNPLYSIFGNSYRVEGLFTYLSYIGFFICGTRLIKDDNNKKIINIFILVALILSILTLAHLDICYKLFNIDKVHDYYDYRAIFPQFNHFAYYLLSANICCIFMFIYSNKYKIIYFIINTILLYTLISNDTLGVIIAYIVGLILLIIYSLIKYKKIKEIICIIISFILIGISAKDYNRENIFIKNYKQIIQDTNQVIDSSSEEQLYSVGTDRGKLWIYAIKYIKQRPLLGYGFDNTIILYTRDNIDQSKPHNHILDLCLNSGVISMICYVILVLSIVIKNLKNIKKLELKYILSLIIVISFILNLMVGNSTFYVSPYFYIFLGVLGQNYYKKVCLE